MIKTRNTLFLILIGLLFILPVMADDDDDNIIAEIVVDLMAGAFIAVCETSATCTGFMNIIAFIGFIILAICACVLGPTVVFEGACSKKNIRRGGTTYIGYRLLKK